MSLTDWKAAGWLVDHEPSRDETRSLLGVIDRDLRDSAVQVLSPDAQLGLAYNAALQVGTIALAAHGDRASRERKQYVTIQSLAVTIGADPAIVRRLDSASSPMVSAAPLLRPLCRALSGKSFFARALVALLAEMRGGAVAVRGVGVDGALFAELDDRTQ
jgi:hypothetical protein